MKYLPVLTAPFLGWTAMIISCVHMASLFICMYDTLSSFFVVSGLFQEAFCKYFKVLIQRLDETDASEHMQLKFRFIEFIRFENMLYASKWYWLPTQFQKPLNVMMAAAKKPRHYLEILI